MDDTELFDALNEAFEGMEPAACWQEFQGLTTEIRTDLLDSAYWALGIDESGPGTGRKVRADEGALAVLQFGIGDPSLIQQDEDGPYIRFPAGQIERMDRMLAAIGPVRTMVLLTFAMGLVSATSGKGRD